jgi:hypothetical protein
MAKIHIIGKRKKCITFYSLEYTIYITCIKMINQIITTKLKGKQKLYLQYVNQKEKEF